MSWVYSWVGLSGQNIVGGLIGCQIAWSTLRPVLPMFKKLRAIELERKRANASTTIQLRAWARIALATVDTDYQNLVKNKTGSVSVV